MITERAVAGGYALGYDAVVDGFGPYEALVAEILSFVERSGGGRPPREVRILDVSCGTGTFARRLAARGYEVTGVDGVAELVAAAQEKTPPAVRANVRFWHADIARDPIPDGGTFDVLVSMHTLYWHPEPRQLLAACRRALRPDGHGIFLTYRRRAEVVDTVRRLRAERGLADGLRSLRWVLPTAVFERLRDCDRRYLDRDEFIRALEGAGFDVLHCRSTFLAGISLLAWVRPAERGPAMGSGPEVSRLSIALEHAGYGGEEARSAE